MPCRELHKCITSGEDWDCQCGNDCGYPVELDCLYHAEKDFKPQNFEDDSHIEHLLSINQSVCPTGIKELETMAKERGINVKTIFGYKPTGVIQ